MSYLTCFIMTVLLRPFSTSTSFNDKQNPFERDRIKNLSSNSTFTSQKSVAKTHIFKKFS